MSLDEFDDVRLRFVFEYVQTMTNMKTEKILKLQEDVKSFEKILNFFETTDETLLIIMMSFGGNLEVFYSFPSVMKNKAYYFVKTSKISYDKSSEIGFMRSNITYGDINKSPLHHFIAFVNTVRSSHTNFNLIKLRFYLPLSSMRKIGRIGQKL